MERPGASVETPSSEEYENQHVHEVYQQIASHFSSTRYKPWPIVESFLKGLPDGSAGLDVGCGNGKYLAVNPKIFIIGSDRSSALTKIASQHKPNSTVIADALSLPHPQARFDFAISIAVVHHLSTSSRRVMAIKAVLDTLKCPPVPESQDDVPTDRGPTAGRALIYVWALEQGGSRRGWDEGCEQDVMVPWVMKGKQDSAANGPEGNNKSQKRARKLKKRDPCGDEDRVQGETHASTAGKPDISLSGDPSRKSSLKVEGPPSNGEGADCENQVEQSAEGTMTFHRYYHLYRSGELERDVVEAGGQILESGYEKDNWWAIAVRQRSR